MDFTLNWAWFPSKSHLLSRPADRYAVARDQDAANRVKGSVLW